MDYKIKEKEAMSFIGISRRFSTIDNQNFIEVPKFWDKIWSLSEAKPILDNMGSMGLVGLCYNGDETMKSFDYMIGVEAKDSISGEGLESIAIPKSLWAVFPSKGPLPEAIQQVWDKIFTDFFKKHPYTHAPLPELEVYYEGDPSSKNYYCEVWIPVKKILKG